MKAFNNFLASWSLRLSKNQINQLSSGLNQLNQAIQNIDVGDTKQLDSVIYQV